MASSHCILLALAACCGGFTQGLTGFGSTLVALPILAMVMDLRLATPVCCMLAVTLNIVLTWRLFGHIRWRALVLLLVTAVPGMALGARALDVVPGDWLKLALAAVVLTFVATARRRREDGPRPGMGWGVLAGFAAGCLGAAIGVNGPPVTMWLTRQGYDRDGLRATQTAYFLLAGFGVVGSQALVGLVTADVLAAYGVAVPALLVGLGLGMAGCGRIGERGFGRAVLFVLAASGLSLLVQGGYGLVVP